MTAKIINLSDRKQRLIEWAAAFAEHLFGKLPDKEREYFLRRLERDLKLKD